MIQAAINWLQRAIRGEIDPKQRLVLICAAILLALVTAYLNVEFPVARLSALGVVYVVAIDALGGLGWGIFGALALSVTFTLTEYGADPIGQRPFVVSTILARLVIFLIVVGLVELIRRQTHALNESELRRSILDLERVRGQLAEATARFRSVGESLPFGVWHCDADGRVIYMSPSFLRLLGITLEDVREGDWLARTAGGCRASAGRVEKPPLLGKRLRTNRRRLLRGCAQEQPIGAHHAYDRYRACHRAL